MISIQGLSFYFGSRALYEEIDLHIKPKDKIGLIGANGTGKSTLLKIIAGELQPDGGSINKSKDCSIGFLNQDLLSFKSEDSILNVVLQAFERENKLLEEINALLVQIETNYDDKLIDRLGKKQEEFDLLGGYTIQSKAEEILEGLGFKTSDLNKPLEEFSGGWRMRVMLGKMLLMQPSLLLLDEPTNHLDLPSIEWLEKYIVSYEGAVILVSHDQTFLNKTITKVAEVSRQYITMYSGNYDFYTKEKLERQTIQKNAFINQQKKIKETEDFINRFKAKATKAKQAQSKLKTLEKLERIDDVQEDNSQINFHFNFKKPSGKIVLDLKDIEKSYGDLEIFKSSNAHILRGDKIALIGANGKGKSTLLRIIEGRETFEGERNEGHHVVSAMFAQHQLEDLTLTNDVLQELIQTGIEKTELEMRKVLGSFLFSDEDIQKKINVLSGGERSRVALAKTLISEANFLLLDEPTNHLDIQSVDMLIQALEQFEGSYVVISHDRHFIKQVANKIWYIEDQYIKEYPGTYDEFNFWMSQKKSTPNKKTEEKPKVEKVKQTNNQDQEAFKEQQKVIKKLKRTIDQSEKNIDKLEQEKVKLEEEMADPKVFSNPDVLAEKSQLFDQKNKQIEAFQEEWENAMIELENLENE